MAKQHVDEFRTQVDVKKPGSILETLTRLHEEINRRAYELFCHRDGLVGPLNDWLRAERELVWAPAIELSQKDGQFELRVAVAGVDPRNLDLQATPEVILITAMTEHHAEHEVATDETVHVRELATGRLFRSVHLPERIDPESVKAEYRNGMLYLRATVADAATKRVDVQAA